MSCQLDTYNVECILTRSYFPGELKKNLHFLPVFPFFSLSCSFYFHSVNWKRGVLFVTISLLIFQILKYLFSELGCWCFFFFLWNNFAYSVKRFLLFGAALATTTKMFKRMLKIFFKNASVFLGEFNKCFFVRGKRRKNCGECLMRFSPRGLSYIILLNSYLSMPRFP